LELHRKRSHQLWIFLAVITFLRLLAAAQMGQTVDEAHYVLYGKSLALSYFDHPPLVGWVHFIFQMLPFNSVVASRIPSLLISVWTSLLIYRYLLGKNVSERNSLLSVGILNLTPLFNSLSIALLPDTLLMPLTVLIIDRTEKLLLNSNFKNWLLLGAYLGLAGLSKYTAVVYILSLIIIFIFKKRFRDFLHLPLWTGVVTALFLVSPVLIWNLQNDFVSFKYQGSHVSSFDRNAFQSFISSLGIQMFSWGIGPFIVALWQHAVFAKSFRDLRTRFVSFVFLSVFLLFFIYISVSEVLLPHWMLIYFVMMVPVAYSQWLEKNSRPVWLWLSVGISALLSLALLFETAFKIFPAKATAPLYEGIYGWPEMIDQANEELNKIPSATKALAVMNWTLGSRALFYNSGRSDVFVLDKRFDQFDLWNPKNPEGYDFIVLVEASKKEEHLRYLECASLEPVGEKIATIKEVPVNHFLYYHCAKFLRLKD
jgi:4-amino-4-deoxy-L-arabinose transferase-like glycosyltransferase